MFNLSIILKKLRMEGIFLHSDGFVYMYKAMVYM